MSLDTEQIARAFCSHKFDLTYSYMAEDIKWTQIGGEERIGREAVIAHCENGKKFLATVKSTITKLDTYRGEGFVVVEGGARFVDQEANTSGVASCDIFHFSNDMLVAIASYVIDLNQA